MNEGMKKLHHYCIIIYKRNMNCNLGSMHIHMPKKISCARNGRMARRQHQLVILEVAELAKDLLYAPEI